MAGIGATYPTIVDLYKAQDPDGGIYDIVQALSQENPILDDMPVMEGNTDYGHMFVSQTALPSPTYRQLNQGVTPGKARSEQIQETAAILELRSEIDVDLVSMSGGAAYRLQQDKQFATGFNNTIATGLFYNSSAATPERFHGFSPRLAATTDPLGAQIIKASGSPSGSDQSSIWLVGWGPGKVWTCYPKGSRGGFMIEDLGKHLRPDADGNDFLAWVTRFQWKIGLVVEDGRYLVRIANCDTSSLAGTGTELVVAMEAALELIYSLASCNPIFYMNRKLKTLLNAQVRAAGGGTNLLEHLTKNGRLVSHFYGVPIHTTDALVNTEAVVS